MMLWHSEAAKKATMNWGRSFFLSTEHKKTLQIPSFLALDLRETLLLRFVFTHPDQNREVFSIKRTKTIVFARFSPLAQGGKDVAKTTHFTRLSAGAAIKKSHILAWFQGLLENAKNHHPFGRKVATLPVWDPLDALRSLEKLQP